MSTHVPEEEQGVVSVDGFIVFDEHKIGETYSNIERIEWDRISLGCIVFRDNTAIKRWSNGSIIVYLYKNSYSFVLVKTKL